MQATVPSGSIGRLKRTKPYVPIFNSTPARITLPAAGACTWANGNQVCSGKSGTLIANPANRATKSQT